MNIQESELVDVAVAWLRERLPASWAIELSARPDPVPESGRASLEIRSDAGQATLAIVAKRSLGPRDVRGLFGSDGRTLRPLSPTIPVLLVAPWLSARTRGLLAREELNYVDLSGNALVRLERPALFIQSHGADRDPAPLPRGKARVRGPKAARLIRTLLDVRPPYGVRELALATELAPGYVSRLLDALDADALIERTKRGPVESVEIGGLARRWAESYDLFRSNESATFLAPRGAAQTLPLLPSVPDSRRLAVTGSFAAVRLAPVAAPALLAIYCEDARAVANSLELIPAEEGANVLLLHPFDPVVWSRGDERDGVGYVAPSQSVVDCLTGNGRMPAEGEALLEWMIQNEPTWRRDSLTQMIESAAPVANQALPIRISSKPQS